VSRRRHAPWIILPCLAGLLLAAAMVTRSNDGPTAAPTDPTTPPAPWTEPSDAETSAVPTEACGVVRYTPPTASAPHKGDLCRPARPRGQAVVLIHGGGGYSGDRSGLEPWSRWYRSHGFVTFAIDYTLVGDGTPAPLYPAP
jgi:acetyl esterase/lipase